ncbi:MAG: FdhF/YdeP family oxidoreductase [Acidobacteria bacterium]|nr:FdhF/YdeP family oxidoreductase [Acidobacteriota bacterium]
MSERDEVVTDDTPEGLGELHVRPPEKIAAGLKAITAATKHAFKKMGPVRGTRALLHLNQKKNGIDCQSCAWPDPDGRRTFTEFCESGAKAMADEGTKERATPELFAKYSIAELSKHDDYWLNCQGRLTHPMVLRPGSEHYEPIEWDEAFAIIGDTLNSLATPDEAIFYTSGRTSNEAAFLYQLFARQFGTNNLPDCSNMCHESSGTALQDSIGLGKTTIRLSDFKECDLVILIGQNPGTCAPRMMSSLQDAKRAGAKMIAINPLPEAGLIGFVNPNPEHYPNPLKFPIDVLGNRPTPLADLFLQVRVGGDMALLKGMIKIMLEREREAPNTVIDHEFIAEYGHGFAEFVDQIDATSWDDILYASGLTREQITEAAEMVIASNRMISCWAMGITQHKDSVPTIQDLVNLHLLRGQIGKPGAGVCPVRGHSNVQGDRTMGIWEKINPRFKAALEKEFKFEVPPHNGWSVVESIEAMRDGKGKVFFGMGGNFLSATPDNDVVFAGLRQCKLTVQVLTKLNRAALACGGTALILPCLGRSEIDVQASGEQFVSTESTMLDVQRSRGIFPPASEHLRSEPWIICQMAKVTLGKKTTVGWDAMCGDYDKIREAIGRVVDGCEDYNTRVREPGGFYLENPPRDRSFRTKTGKANFITRPLEPLRTEEGQLLLTTIRSHNQFNTTIYGYSDRYRGIEGSRRVVLMNAGDIQKFGLEAGQVVNLTSHFKGETRQVRDFIVVPYPIPVGCAAAYYPEANPLVALGSRADWSLTPTSKSIVITVEPTSRRSGTFEKEVLAQPHA